jgi:hypothetical protein
LVSFWRLYDERPILEARTQPMQLANPLSRFNWSSLYNDYDALCHRFDPAAAFLDSFSPRPESDRTLYYALVDRFSNELRSPAGIGIESYEALLYWKLYSQPAAIANTCKPLRANSRLREATRESLRVLSARLPRTIGKDSIFLVDLTRSLNADAIWGMKSSTSLPVRTTFLHVLQPAVVPIFDRQVLLAVGVTDRNANQSLRFLQTYIPHAWSLANLYSAACSAFQKETDVRLVDMAMWVVRGGCK